MTRFPVLMPDVEVSRNLRRHALTIPGEDASFAFATVQNALDFILSHGFDEFILHLGKDDYFCRPAQRNMLDQLSEPPAPDDTGEP